MSKVPAFWRYGRYALGAVLGFYVFPHFFFDGEEHHGGVVAPPIVTSAQGTQAASETLVESATPSPLDDARQIVAVPTPSGDSDVDIGSEGYGPWIAKAAIDGDATQKWRALNWLRRCRFNDDFLAEAERARQTSGASPALIEMAVKDALITQRRCQTIDDQHRALAPEMAWGAMVAGVDGAAARYVEAVDFVLQEGDRKQIVIDSLKAEASRGNAEAISWIALHGWKWGMSVADWSSFVAKAAGKLRSAGQTEVADIIETGRVGDIPIRPASAPR
jgi:hypothetical protein